MNKLAVCFTCLLLLLSASASQALEGIQTDTVVYDIESNHNSIDISNELAYKPEIGIQLAYISQKGYPNRGILYSKWLTSKNPSNDIILSWNLDLPLGTGALVEARLGEQDGKTSTAWYEIARIGKLPVLPKALKQDAYGRVDEDTIVTKSKWNQVQYRVTLFTILPHHTPTLRLMAVCASDTKIKIPYVPYLKDGKQKPWMRSIPVRWRSQIIEDPSIAGSICGPTSLSQALEYWECKIPTADVAAEAYDETNHIFGNWPFLAQAAAQHGFQAWTIRCKDFSPIEREIAEGHPIILSLQFSKGELSNGPIESTNGHLVLCVGMNSDGDLLVNDSASTDPIFSHRVYKRDEISKIWLSNKGGAAICIHPRRKDIAINK